MVCKSNGDVVEQSRNKRVNCCETLRSQGSLSVTKKFCD